MRAAVVKASAFQPVPGSAAASAAIVAPLAMPGRSACFWASVPASAMAVAAMTVEPKKGEGRSARPASSAAMASSETPKPAPP